MEHGWNAIYSDGSSLPRFSESGEENGYQSIDRERLVRFDVLVDSRTVASVYVERPTQKLIYRRRNYCDLSGNDRGTVLLLGWHENLDGKSVKSIMYLYPDGHVELAGARDDLELVPCEY